MTALAHEKDYSKTWMLFESGNSVTVDLSLYSPPGGKTRPIDAYIVTECEGDFTGSARRAAEAVYDIIGQNHSKPDPLIVGYDLQGLPAGRPLSGESGGLAFAIAVAKRLIKHDPGPVAATGEVKGSHGGGPVGAVKGITAKLTAALHLVPSGGWVLYPQDNDTDIPEALRSTLTDKGIKLRAVSSVAEALKLLFELPNSRSEAKIQAQNKRRLFLLSALLLVLLTIGVFAFMRANNWPPFSPDISPTPKEKNHAHVSNGAINGRDVNHSNFPNQSSSTMPKGNTISKLEIDFPGDTLLASNLGQLITDRITGLFNNDSVSTTGKINLHGKVVIMNISEGATHGKGADPSEITVAVKGLRNNNVDMLTFPGFRVTATGKGSVSSLLPLAASELTENIVMELARDGHVTLLKPFRSSDATEEKENKNKTQGNKGFE